MSIFQKNEFVNQKLKVGAHGSASTRSNARCCSAPLPGPVPTGCPAAPPAASHSTKTLTLATTPTTPQPDAPRRAAIGTRHDSSCRNAVGVLNLLWPEHQETS
jgi:hypothetical protein